MTPLPPPAPSVPYGPGASEPVDGPLDVTPVEVGRTVGKTVGKVMVRTLAVFLIRAIFRAIFRR
jgi:hypothetical protein